MKKQLLIAAVAATMTSVAFADISITGGAKVNFTATDTVDAANSNTIKHDIDLTVAGNTGATGVVMTVSNANIDDTAAATTTGLTVENAYVTSSVAGVNIKMGQWAETSDSLLTDQKSTYEAGKISLDTTVGGVKIQFEDENQGDSSVTVSGEMAGVKLSHEVYQADTDTKINATVAGVSIAYRVRDRDAADKNTSSLQLTKDFSGMTFTYASIDTDTSATAISADGWIAGSGIKDADGFGVSMPLAGNTVQAKRITITDAEGDDKSTKLYVTRKLASGATFEAIYTDTDNAAAQADTTSLDLELAVKF